MEILFPKYSTEKTKSGDAFSLSSVIESHIQLMYVEVQFGLKAMFAQALCNARALKPVKLHSGLHYLSFALRLKSFDLQTIRRFQNLKKTVCCSVNVRLLVWLTTLRSISFHSFDYKLILYSLVLQGFI